MILILMAASWTVGIYLATRVDFTWPSVLLFLLASALLATLLRGRGLTVLPALALALLTLGGLRAGWPGETAAPLPVQAYNGVGGIEVEGVVSSDPQPRGSGWRFSISVERVRAVGEWADSRGELLVVARPPPSLVSSRDERFFRYGDRLVVTGTAETPPVFQDFDYRDYLAGQGIFSTMVYPDVDLVGEGGGNSLLDVVYSVRYRLSRSLSQAVAEPQSSLAQALLLGRRTTLPPELTQAFRDTGTSHLLAISGLHVGVLLGLSVAFSRWLLGARRQLYLLVPLLSVWAYAALSGMSPSVERAAIMGSIYLAGMYLGRQNSIMPALAVAAAIMVGIQPGVLTSVSFQLSFTAMAGLALLAPPIERWLRRAFSEGEDEGSWTRALSYAIAATVAATVATLPLVAFYFHQLSLVGLPATLLALPAVPFILVTGLVTSLLGLVSLGAAQVVGWAPWLLLSYLKAVVELFDSIPGNTLSIGWMGTPLVVAYYGAFMALIAVRSRVERLGATIHLLPESVRHPRCDSKWAESWLPRGRVFWAPFALAALAAATVWTAALAGPDGRLHVTFLDIGQGDAILIVTPGGRQVLIDGGPDPQRLMTLLGERVPFWDHSLDMVVLTHPHEDHAAGLAEVLRRYDVDLALERETDYPSPAYALWRSALEEGKVPILQAATGQRITLDSGLALEVLYPPERLLEGTSSDQNNASVVVRLVYGETSFLFSGDIQMEVESFIMHRPLSVQSTVFKVAHHGSRSSTGPEFLLAVSPQVAVISAGEDNRFGHPHQETLDTLGRFLPQERIRLTATDGNVEFVSDGSRLWMRTER